MVSFLLNLEPEEALTLTQPNDTIFQLKGQDDGYDSCHFIRGEGPINGLPRSLVWNEGRGQKTSNTVSHKKPVRSFQILYQ